jgi:hypothetical protein
MKAIEITRAGGPEVLAPTQRPVPLPQAAQVLIKVAYARINRHDCGQRARGHGPKDATDIPGLEVSGENRRHPVMPLDQAAGAHARMESSVHIGKILLSVGE